MSIFRPRTDPAGRLGAESPGAVRPAAPAIPAIEVQGLRRVFRLQGRGAAAVTALDDVGLTLPAGSFTALVGASGCGKSTLLQCIAGLDAPTAGTVSLLGTRTSELSSRAAARFRARHVGFIFQDDNLVTSLSARDNVALPGRLRRRPLSRRGVDEALERVGLSAQARHLPHQMSGGERQRVAIARVLASCPDLVFADEPTAALDVGAAATVLDWLAALAGQGAGGTGGSGGAGGAPGGRDAARATVLMVTHDAAAAARAQRVLVMDAGCLVASLPGGDPAAVSAAVLSAREDGRRDGRQDGARAIGAARSLSGYADPQCHRGAGGPR
ncbi:ABC transporter ATP-binding protein [Actinomyces capricornis]|nr:ATP-binding cassette domain-containing protein [Actinomyces capricornis]